MEELRLNKMKYLSITLLGLGILYIALLILPIKVLKNWHISVDKSSYTVGDTITLTSAVTKERNANGHSVRTLICNSQGATSEYTINTSPAVGVAGTRKTIRQFTASGSINNLPAQCRVEITAHYWIWYIKPIKETAQTGEFTIK